MDYKLTGCAEARLQTPQGFKVIGKVSARHLTTWQTVRECARETFGVGIIPKDTAPEPPSEWKTKMLICEHSPIRALLFQIELTGIPSWVSVHYVRHKYVVEHFVQSQRNDRRSDGLDRNSQPQSAPVNHMMVCNAAEIIFMARKRLCMKASPETRAVMRAIVDALDMCGATELARILKPDCAYRGGFCPELKSCGCTETIFDRFYSEKGTNK